MPCDMMHPLVIVLLAKPIMTKSYEYNLWDFASVEKHVATAIELSRSCVNRWYRSRRKIAFQYAVQ